MAEGYDTARTPWWESIILLRKLALQCIVTFFQDNFVQVSVASWVFVTALVLQACVLLFRQIDLFLRMALPGVGVFLFSLSRTFFLN